jgi:hypothetical protein
MIFHLFYRYTSKLIFILKEWARHLVQFETKWKYAETFERHRCHSPIRNLFLLQTVNLRIKITEYLNHFLLFYLTFFISFSVLGYYLQHLTHHYICHLNCHSRKAIRPNQWLTLWMIPAEWMYFIPLRIW